jgi:hypothetical protein
VNECSYITFERRRGLCFSSVKTKRLTPEREKTLNNHVI